MDNPNITMEEYIRLEEEKARRCGKVYNWETAKYDKIWYDEDVHDLRSIEIEFPVIRWWYPIPAEVGFITTCSYLNDLPLRYQVYQRRLLLSFQDDAKYEHLGQDTRSQGGKDDQD
ncbi:hypothetical protein Tco_1418311 [Tanacetum coccineum]